MYSTNLIRRIATLTKFDDPNRSRWVVKHDQVKAFFAGRRKGKEYRRLGAMVIRAKGSSFVIQHKDMQRDIALLDKDNNVTCLIEHPTLGECIILARLTCSHVYSYKNRNRRYKTFIYTNAIVSSRILFRAGTKCSTSGMVYTSTVLPNETIVVSQNAKRKFAKCMRDVAPAIKAILRLSDARFGTVYDPVTDANVNSPDVTRQVIAHVENGLEFPLDRIEAIARIGSINMGYYSRNALRRKPPAEFNAELFKRGMRRIRRAYYDLPGNYMIDKEV